ncbi:MAG: hypothetical protein HKN13_13465 [Rhodothermales bacterium]|nr:hypothetical protein [Rhodothermales bacterium]
MRITTLLFVVAVAGCDSASEDPGETDNPFAVFGDAETNPGDWVWIPVAESTCRDGSSTGFGFRYHSGATSAVIYLDGGGACYDAFTCSLNRSRFSESDFENVAGTSATRGFFNLDRSESPFSESHQAFFSYCTGDLHSASSVDVDVPGVTAQQQFVGYDNVTQFLRIVDPYLKSLNIQNLIVAGSSAGALGAMINYPKIKSSYPNIPVDLITDALPLFNDTDVMPACFQSHTAEVMKLLVPVNCAECSDPDRGGFSNLYDYLSTSYPGENFAMISSSQDLFWRGLLGSALPGSCPARDLLDGAIYETGLKKLRDEVLKPAGNWSTYFWDGLEHTLLFDEDNVYGPGIGGTNAAEWATSISSGQPVHLGLD